MIDPKHLLNWVIRPILIDIGNHSENAERLVLGTACQESECGRWLMQLGDGPARGIYQSERPAMADNIVFIERHPALKMRCQKWIKSEQPWTVDDLMKEVVWNLAAATIMCRVHYLRFPDPIPNSLPGHARYWKQFYNTEKGAGMPDQYVASWRRFIPAGLI